MLYTALLVLPSHSSGANRDPFSTLMRVEKRREKSQLLILIQKKQRRPHEAARGLPGQSTYINSGHVAIHATTVININSMDVCSRTRKKMEVL